MTDKIDIHSFEVSKEKIATMYISILLYLIMLSTLNIGGLTIVSLNISS